MFCKFCGSQVPDGNKFCPSCGSPMEKPQPQPNYDQNAYQTNNYQQNAYQQNTYQQNAYQQPYGSQPTGGGFAAVTQRNIGMCILLSIITCGIYNIFWFFAITDDTNKISGDPNATSGGMAFLYSLITCGLYTFFWMYKRGEIIDNYNRSRGLGSTSNSIIYLVLTIFGLGFISYCLVQNELNKIARGF